MGKTPPKASAGIVIAMLMSAGCQSTPTTVPSQSTMQQQAMNRSQAWGNQNTASATNNLTQGGATGLPNNQLANNQANTRPQSGQGFGSSGNFQNNFTNTAQQSGGVNPNPGTGNVQPAGYSQNAGGVQQAGYSSNQYGAGVQQAGGWPSNTQTQQAGSAMGRNLSRNTDDVYSGSNGGSAPPPQFPAGGNASNTNSLDPPAVASPNGSGTTSKYETLPFNSSRSGGY
jgi:hypothetical protein